MALSLSLLIVYLGFYLFIVFLSLSIACGLYYLAELIEEFTLTTKKIIGHAIKAELILHLLLFIDRLPFHCIALGLGAHVSYTSLLKKFPYMQLTSPEGLTAIATFILSSVAWVYHYWKTYYTIEYILAFLLVTTGLVPFAFFLGMAGDQSVLPGAGGYPYSSPQPSRSGSFSGLGDAGDSNATRKKPRRGLALRIFEVLKRKRDDYLPGVVSHLPASSGLMPKEKI